MVESDWSQQPVNMREIQASQAKVHLLELLDAVEQGETLIITRHGRRIARIAPETSHQQQEVEKAIEGIRALRKRVGKMSYADILSARDEGRRV